MIFFMIFLMMDHSLPRASQSSASCCAYARRRSWWWDSCSRPSTPRRTLARQSVLAWCWTILLIWFYKVEFSTQFFLFSQHFQLQIAPPSRTWLAVYRYIYLLISLSNRDSSHFTLFSHTAKVSPFHSDFRKFPQTILIFLAGLKTRREIFHIFHTRASLLYGLSQYFRDEKYFSSFKPLFGSGALCTRFLAEIFFLPLFSLFPSRREIVAIWAYLVHFSRILRSKSDAASGCGRRSNKCAI